MNKHILLVSLVLAQLVYVNCFEWAVVAITTDLSTIIKNNEGAGTWTVEVHNESKHYAHLWCAFIPISSAEEDEIIGGYDGVWVKPGEKLGWSFDRKPTTRFWCNMEWYGQSVGWDVFVGKWKDVTNPTKWSIRNDGIYDQWKNRKWHNLDSES